MTLTAKEARALYLQHLEEHRESVERHALEEAKFKWEISQQNARFRREIDEAWMNAIFGAFIAPEPHISIEGVH